MMNPYVKVRATPARGHFQNPRKIALLVSIACVMQMAESLIPYPVPGLRLGLANVVTLMTLVMLGLGPALEVTVLRTLLASFLMGTFMSPAFILSLTAGVFSTLAMGFALGISALFRNKKLRMTGIMQDRGTDQGLGVIGVSVIGALVHNLVQLYLAYFLIIKHPGIFVFLPWLCLGAVITGWVIGMVAGNVCLNLETGLFAKNSAAVFNAPADSGTGQISFAVAGRYLSARSWIHCLPSGFKFGAVMVLSIIALTMNQFQVCNGLFLVLFLILIAARMPIRRVVMTARRYLPMIFVAMFFPLFFFNSATHMLFQAYFLKISAEGLQAGLLLSLRILFLVLLSDALVLTTSPRELGRILARILAPFKTVGISGTRIARVFSLSFLAIPILWEISKKIISSFDFRSNWKFSSFVPLITDFMTRFYLESEAVITFTRRK